MKTPGPYETLAQSQGIEAKLLRKNLNTMMFIIGVTVRDYTPEELEIPMKDIKSMEDVYKCILGKYL